MILNVSDELYKRMSWRATHTATYTGLFSYVWVPHWRLVMLTIFTFRSRWRWQCLPAVAHSWTIQENGLMLRMSWCVCCSVCCTVCVAVFVAVCVADVDNVYLPLHIHELYKRMSWCWDCLPGDPPWRARQPQRGIPASPHPHPLYLYIYARLREYIWVYVCVSMYVCVEMYVWVRMYMWVCCMGM